MRKEIDLPDNLNEQQLLFGKSDKNLKLLRERFSIRIITRGEILLLDGDVKAVNTVSSILYKIIRKIENGHSDVERTTRNYTGGGK